MIFSSDLFRLFLIVLIVVAVLLILPGQARAQSDAFFLGKWGSGPGTGNGQFDRPSDVAINPKTGIVYVVERWNHRVQVFDKEGNYINKWGKNDGDGSEGSGDSEFNQPMGIEVNPNTGDVYVVDFGNSCVKYFDKDGTFKGKTIFGELFTPVGIGLDATGNVYITDTFIKGIKKYNPSLNAVLATYTPTELEWVYDVAIDPSGDLYIANGGQNNIVKLDSSGAFIKSWGETGSGEGQFNMPMGIDLDVAGNVYVADTFNHRIQKFDSEGTFLYLWGSGPSADDGSFNQPYGIDVDTYIRIADYNNHRIQAFGEPKVYFPNIAKEYDGWNTTFALQNLGAEDANIDILFIDNSGNHVLKKEFTGVSYSSSALVNPKSETVLGTTFQGSAIVFSNNLLASIVNEHSSNCSMAYEGIDTLQKTNKVYLPNITHDYYGWTTPFFIQNLSSTKANIEVDFFRKGSSDSAQYVSFTLEPGVSRVINPGEYQDLGKFQGSVVIVSDRKVGAIVNEHLGNKQAMSYNGFSDGQSVVFMPNITRKYFGFTTPFIIQNVGASSTSPMTVRFYRKGASSPTLTKTFFPLPAGASIGINPINYSILGTFQGSAEIVAGDSSDKIVAIVNEHSSVDSMAYSGENSDKTIINLPNITRSYAGWTTPFIVQNLGTKATNITIRFYRKGDSLPELTMTITSLLPGSSSGINPKSFTSLGIFQGSVLLESSNGVPVTAIVNEHHVNGQAMAYNGFAGQSSQTGVHKREFPDTSNGIFVFNDQLSNSLTDEQIEFAANNYSGCQKMTKQDADRLRSFNPEFLILHYRLGIGLGYQSPPDNWISVIEGNNWVREWPDDSIIRDEWFFEWAGERVLNEQWLFYLTELNNESYREYWIDEILRQMEANDNDGLFADSYSVPNYFGGTVFNPDLPAVDAVFEASWTERLENFSTYIMNSFSGNYYLIPNAGSWITSRDTTDYSGSDGVMIEGFAADGTDSFYDLSDWQLQMNRILSLVNQDRIIISQSYINNLNDVDMRLFYLTNYLLVKGKYSYINIDYDYEPEYFPEYDIQLGAPVDGLPDDIDDFLDSSGIYMREYENGIVLVNPTSTSRYIDLGEIFNQAIPDGGGLVPADGDISSWHVHTVPLTEITLAPHNGAILLKP